MNKRLSILLLLIMTLVYLTACNRNAESLTTSSDLSQEEQPGKNVEAEALYDVDENGRIVFPLKETVTFTAFVHTRPNVDDFENNAMTKWVKDAMNIELEFVVAMDNEGQEMQNLLLATGEYPDLLMTTRLSQGQQALYGRQGLLLPLNDLIEGQGTLTKEIFHKHPHVEQRITMKDGNIYNLPRYSECFHCRLTQKLWIYKPWLETLGLEMPETTEDFYEVLKAFATQDPNGNGIADEIPLAGALNGWETEVEAAIMNAFTYNATYQSGAKRLSMSNGRVIASYTTEGWKEGLKYLQKLRYEGLLAEESFTQAGYGLLQMGENPTDIVLGTFPGGYPGVGTDLSGNRWRDYEVVPPLEGPDGTRLVKYDPYGGISPGFSITNVCEYPEIAMAMADFFYSNEFSISNTAGRLGVDWEFIDDDQLKGINGEKAIWHELVPFAEQKPNGSWNQMGNNYNPTWLHLGKYQADTNNLEAMLYRETMEKQFPYYPSAELMLPPLQMTKEQSAELLTYSTSIDEFVEQKMAEFVLGNDDIDLAWEGYLAEVYGLGLEKMLDVYQQAYNDSVYADQ